MFVAGHEHCYALQRDIRSQYDTDKAQYGQEYYPPLKVEVLNGVTDMEKRDWLVTPHPDYVLMIAATNVINSSLSIPGLKRRWTFCWKGATQYAPVQGWEQITTMKQTSADEQQVVGPFCRSGQKGWLTTQVSHQTLNP